MTAEIRPQRISFVPTVKDMEFFTKNPSLLLPELAFPIFKLITKYQEQGLTTGEIIHHMQNSEYMADISEFLKAIDDLFVHGFIHKLITYADTAEPATASITYQNMMAY